jgi:hypothetical protein
VVLRQSKLGGREAKPFCWASRNPAPPSYGSLSACLPDPLNRGVSCEMPASYHLVLLGAPMGVPEPPHLHDDKEAGQWALPPDSHDTPRHTTPRGVGRGRIIAYALYNQSPPTPDPHIAPDNIRRAKINTPGTRCTVGQCLWLACMNSCTLGIRYDITQSQVNDALSNQARQERRYRLGHAPHCPSSHLLFVPFSTYIPSPPVWPCEQKVLLCS